MAVKKKNKEQKYLVTIINRESGKEVFCFDTPTFTLQATTLEKGVPKGLTFEFMDVLDVLQKPEKEE